MSNITPADLVQICNHNYNYCLAEDSSQPNVQATCQSGWYDCMQDTIGAPCNCIGTITWIDASGSPHSYAVGVQFDSDMTNAALIAACSIGCPYNGWHMCGSGSTEYQCPSSDATADFCGTNGQGCCASANQDYCSADVGCLPTGTCPGAGGTTPTTVQCDGYTCPGGGGPNAIYCSTNNAGCCLQSGQDFCSIDIGCMTTGTCPGTQTSTSTVQCDGYTCPGGGGPSAIYCSTNNAGCCLQSGQDFCSIDIGCEPQGQCPFTCPGNSSVTCLYGQFCDTTNKGCCTASNQEFCSVDIGCAAVGQCPGDAQSSSSAAPSSTTPTPTPAVGSSSSTPSSASPTPSTSTAASSSTASSSSKIPSSTTLKSSTISSQSQTQTNLLLELSTAVPPAAQTDPASACFLMTGASSAYTTPNWYTSLPPSAQSMWSSLHATPTTGNISSVCTTIPSSSHALSPGATAGAAVGAIGGVALIGIIALWFLKSALFAGIGIGAASAGGGAASGVGGGAAGSVGGMTSTTTGTGLTTSNAAGTGLYDPFSTGAGLGHGAGFAAGAAGLGAGAGLAAGAGAAGMGGGVAATTGVGGGVAGGHAAGYAPHTGAAAAAVHANNLAPVPVGVKRVEKDDEMDARARYGRGYQDGLAAMRQGYGPTGVPMREGAISPVQSVNNGGGFSVPRRPIGGGGGGMTYRPLLGSGGECGNGSGSELDGNGNGNGNGSGSYRGSGYHSVSGGDVNELSQEGHNQRYELRGDLGGHEMGDNEERMDPSRYRGIQGYR